MTKAGEKKKLIAAAAAQALRNIKPKDDRPQRLGWAPGGYVSLCSHCKAFFTGDKRAIQCADCAYEPSSSSARP